MWLLVCLFVVCFCLAACEADCVVGCTFIHAFCLFGFLLVCAVFCWFPFWEPCHHVCTKTITTNCQVIHCRRLLCCRKSCWERKNVLRDLLIHLIFLSVVKEMPLPESLHFSCAPIETPQLTVTFWCMDRNVKYSVIWLGNQSFGDIYSTALKLDHLVSLLWTLANTIAVVKSLWVIPSRYPAWISMDTLFFC